MKQLVQCISISENNTNNIMEDLEKGYPLDVSTIEYLIQQRKEFPPELASRLLKNRDLCDKYLFHCIDVGNTDMLLHILEHSEHKPQLSSSQLAYYFVYNVQIYNILLLHYKELLRPVTAFMNFYDHVLYQCKQYIPEYLEEWEAKYHFVDSLHIHLKSMESRNAYWISCRKSFVDHQHHFEFMINNTYFAWKDLISFLDSIQESSCILLDELFIAHKIPISIPELTQLWKFLPRHKIGINVLLHYIYLEDNDEMFTILKSDQTKFFDQGQIAEDYLSLFLEDDKHHFIQKIIDAFLFTPLLSLDTLLHRVLMIPTTNDLLNSLLQKYPCEIKDYFKSTIDKSSISLRNLEWISLHLPRVRIDDFDYFLSLLYCIYNDIYENKEEYIRIFKKHQKINVGIETDEVEKGFLAIPSKSVFRSLLKIAPEWMRHYALAIFEISKMELHYDLFMWFYESFSYVVTEDELYFFYYSAISGKEYAFLQWIDKYFPCMIPSIIAKIFRKASMEDDLDIIYYIVKKYPSQYQLKIDKENIVTSIRIMPDITNNNQEAVGMGTCCICYDEKNIQLRKTSCQHTFCIPCLEEWWNKSHCNTTCPYCRQQVEYLSDC